MDSRYRIGVDRCRGNEPPSFSSTLLDSICRSFDESGHVRRIRGVGDADGPCSLLDRNLDRWMEKTTNTHEEFIIRRRSVSQVKMNSSSMSSSDSSSGLGFSSSDTDSFSGNKNKKKTSLKPIRTSVSESETFRPRKSQFANFADELLYRKKRLSDQTPEKCDGKKTAKSRAMKIYGELKRIKQPISPGGKVASFLTSLFSPGRNAKKQRISTSMPATSTIGNYKREILQRSEFKSNTTTPSCSTRSCLSKFPASSSEKRSVRFHGVSNGATSRRNSKSEIEVTLQVVESNRKSVEEVAKDLMRDYYKKWGTKDLMIEDQEDADDVESCCSSDLFELDNLMEIGLDKYSTELPVYETTHVHTNRAIASGLI